MVAMATILLVSSVRWTEKVTIVIAHVSLSIRPSVRPSEINILTATTAITWPMHGQYIAATSCSCCADGMDPEI